jgi:hypothetical protein
MEAKEFYDFYINSNENELDIYDKAMIFFSKELPYDLDEEYDFFEIVLEIQDSLQNAKMFQKTFDFIELIKKNQEELFEEAFPLWINFIISYHYFYDNINEIEIAFKAILKNIVHNYDDFLSVFRKLLFCQKIEIIDKGVDTIYEEIINTDEIYEGSEYDLAILKLFNSLEHYYLKSLEGVVFEKKQVIRELEMYNFIDLEETISFFEKGLLDNDLQVQDIEEKIVKNKSEAMHILQAQFIKSMLEKEFRFALSARIWELMMVYWESNNKKSKNYFTVDNKKFDKHLLNLAGRFLLNNESEMFGLLWGSIYVYDFLYENELINFQDYNHFAAIYRELKAVLIVNKPTSLWEFKFVHEWQKPKGISESEFVNEAKIFEKSVMFNKFSFDEFKHEIVEELEDIGVLSNYIFSENEKEIKKFNAENYELDSFFNYSDDDFFIPPTNLKPIVKSIGEKIGRNDTCYCGSGKKYKKCCINK